MRKTIDYIRNTAAALLVILGCMGIWSTKPFTAILLTLAGICMFGRLYELIHIRSRLLQLLLPLGLMAAGIVLLWLPNSEVTAAFSIKESHPSVVYVTENGTRYHAKKSCAGKTAKQDTRTNAISKGYTPCGKCAQ